MDQPTQNWWLQNHLSLGSSWKLSGCSARVWGHGKKIPLEAQVSSGHPGKEGLVSQHHNPEPGKAIKRMRDDISVVYKDKSDRHDKIVIRSHDLAGFQEITLGRSVWMKMNHHRTLSVCCFATPSGSRGLTGKQTQKFPIFAPRRQNAATSTHFWSLEMSPSGSQNAPGFRGLCWLSLALWQDPWREGGKQQVCITRELKFPSDNYTIKKSPISSFHRTAAPFLGCLWRSDSQTNTESSIQAGRSWTFCQITAPISLAKDRAPLPWLI